MIYSSIIAQTKVALALVTIYKTRSMSHSFIKLRYVIEDTRIESMINFKDVSSGEVVTSFYTFEIK